ncbi:MAG: chlorite dismutase family protein [Dehalococcoidia bacterium]
MTATESRLAHVPGAHSGPARGVQSVKFSFFRVADHVRRADAEGRAALGEALTGLLARSGGRMLTRVYSTVGTRGDTDFLVWQVHDDLQEITEWHADLLRSPLGGALERPHSFLSMTMRSVYANPLHEGAATRERLREDGGTNRYLFVYPMAKTRAWYELPAADRQQMMAEHIEVGHRYHGIKINTTYSYGLDDQEFVVAFEGDDPGEFLALVRELRDSRASAYTLFDTPMFTCRLLNPGDLAAHLGLVTTPSQNP